MKMQFNSKAPNATKAVYQVSIIFLIDLLTSGVQSTRISMVDNAPHFRVFDVELTKHSDFVNYLCEKLFSDLFSYFLDKGFGPPFSCSAYEQETTCNVITRYLN